MCSHEQERVAITDELYWNIGEYISRTIESAAWGEAVVDQAAAHIAQKHPALRGFTRANLFRMRQFYETYWSSEKVAPLVRQLPWTHNLIILSKLEFYLEALDRTVKKPHEGPSIGVLLCATKLSEADGRCWGGATRPGMDHGSRFPEDAHIPIDNNRKSNRGRHQRPGYGQEGLAVSGK